MGRVLVVGGAVLVLLGLLVMAGFPLFRLPGDFTVRRGPVTFYFPLVTSILLSILFTLADDALPAMTDDARRGPQQRAAGRPSTT